MRSFDNHPPATSPIATEAGRLLGFAGPVAGRHALIVGAPGPELLCALLRAGCEAALSVREVGKLGERGYDLVLAPCLQDETGATRLARFAARALSPAGRLVARADGAPNGAVCASLARALRQEGFAAIQTRAIPGGALLRADGKMAEWTRAIRCAA